MAAKTNSPDVLSDEKKSRLENRRLVNQMAKEDERKFEYFFAGLASTAFGYSAQQYKRPPNLDSLIAWIEPIAIGLTLVSMICSIWRLAELVRASGFNARMIDASDDRDTLNEALRDLRPGELKNLITGEEIEPTEIRFRSEKAGALRKQARDSMFKHLRRAQTISPIRFYGLGAGVLLLFVARLMPSH